MKLLAIILFVSGMFLPWAKWETNTFAEGMIQSFSESVSESSVFAAYVIGCFDDGSLTGFEVGTSFAALGYGMLTSGSEVDIVLEGGAMLLVAALGFLLAIPGVLGSRLWAFLAVGCEVGFVYWLRERVGGGEFGEVKQSLSDVGIGAWLTVLALALAVLRPPKKKAEK